jgi:hypothetical protein
MQPQEKKESKSMKNKEKQTKEAPKNPKQQVQIKPAAENLSEAELDKVAGGGANAVNSSRSNIKDN